jgi:hypothetical protein
MRAASASHVLAQVEWCPERAQESSRVEGHLHEGRFYNSFMFFVYMVRCADGTLYTGFARDPNARVQAHNSGKGSKYTRSRLRVSLVYTDLVGHSAPP